MRARRGDRETEGGFIPVLIGTKCWWHLSFLRTPAETHNDQTTKLWLHKPTTNFVLFLTPGKCGHGVCGLAARHGNSLTGQRGETPLFTDDQVKHVNALYEPKVYLPPPPLPISL